MTREEAIKYLQQLYPNGGHCWLDEQRIEAIGMVIQALQEESVSEDLKYTAETHSLLVPSELYHLLQKEQQKLWKKEIEDTFKAGAQWQKQRMIKDAIETTLSKGLEEDYNIKVKYKAYIMVIKED